MKASRSSALCALLALSAAAIFGQTFGEITGRISDASGAAVPGVTITLTSTSTNAVRTTISTDSGDYTFPSVPPGIYTTSRSSSKALRPRSATTLRCRCNRLCAWISRCKLARFPNRSRLRRPPISFRRKTRRSEPSSRTGNRSASAQWAQLPESGRAVAECEHAFASLRPSGLAPGRRPRQPVDLGRRAAHHV